VTAALVLSSCSSVDPELEKRNKFDACVIEERAKYLRERIGAIQGERLNRNAQLYADMSCKDLLK
jgi:uncharacterized protein YydD (DUF2326 family)